MSDTYLSDKIKVLEGLEAVRKRPAMYIGSTDGYGLHHLVFEIVDNAIDEALAGFCTEISVEILKGEKIRVIDNGRGIPVDLHKQYKRPALEIVMTKLHAGGKFDGKAYKVSGGLHGVGSSVVNALSKYMEVDVYRDGFRYNQKYERGKPLYDMKKIKRSSSDKFPYKSGTVVVFLPDDTIFTVRTFSFDVLAKRLRELAFLNKGITIHFKDLRSTKIRENTYKFDGGISSFISHINKNKTALHSKPIYFQDIKDDVDVEIALEYNAGYTELIFTYANNINTREGGTHLSGFKAALTRIMNEWIKKAGLNKKFTGVLQGDDVREGLTAVISVKIKNPQFEGQTKMKLGNNEVKGIVASIAYDGLNLYFENNPKVIKAILEKCMVSARSRIAARKARELTRRKNVLESGTLPGKLADCSSRKAFETELYIVEGDSAGGSAKQGRDRRFQAILPLKGKILNVEKSRLDKVISNDEIKTLISAIGASITKDDFDISKVRYGKIIIMTDADVDGAHIRTLLLTFFYRYYKELIDAGYIYIAQPPLYRIATGRTVQYAYNDNERDKILKKLKDKNIKIQRYKGLGEMNPDQLWETTMNPEHRSLLHIELEDEVETDNIFNILMGNQVDDRRKFIEENSLSVKNLDI